jgi:hypothetical protein
MENFFIDDRFFSDMEDYFVEYEIDHFDTDEEKREHINSYPDDWEQKVELAECEPIIPVNEKLIGIITESLCDMNDDRLPEEPDNMIEKIKQALSQSIDLDKLKKAMPEMWYPSGKFNKLTKQDLLDAI